MNLLLLLALAPLVAEAPKPLLEDVRFEERVYFKDETLRGFLRSVVGAEIDERLLELDRAALEQQYRDRGYLSANIELALESTGLPGQQIAVFAIAAGERAELRSVVINGNKLIDDVTLREGFFSRGPEPLGGLTRAGLFHQPYLDQDGRRLMANYYKRGFLEARVTRTRVKAYAGLDGLEVVLDVIEGQEFELAGLELEGELPEGDKATLRDLVTVKDGDIADLVTLQTEANTILDPLREDGYAFARFEQASRYATPPSGRTDRKAVVVQMRAVRGPQAKVRKVHIVGNKGTQDHVIRRDVTVLEGEIYKQSELIRTQQRLMGTGFFAQVTARPVPAAEPDEVDVEVRVQEQPTFLFNLAPVVTANEGLVGVLVLADRNLFGTGLTASFIGQLSAIRQLFDVSLTEPRLLDSRVSLSAEVHRRELVYQGYRLRSDVGGGLRLGVPFGLGFVGSVGATVEFTGITLNVDEGLCPDASVSICASSPLLPRGQLRNVLDLSLAYDRRDSVLAPRNGLYARLSTSYTGALTLAGVDAAEASANLRFFWTPLWQVTFKTNTQLGGLVNPLGGDVAVTDRFFLGGFGSVRGYFPRSIGPKRALAIPGAIATIDTGGTAMFAQNLEAEFPVWPNTPFRGFVFLDAGQSWGEGEALFGPVERDGAELPLGLFWSTGFGFLIETPVFPFRFEWSVPLTRRAFDRELDFFLGVGSAF